MTPSTFSPRAWEAVDNFLLLQRNELQIWRIGLSDVRFEACMPHLNIAEKERAERIRQPQARQQFVIGRACLRLLLGNIFGITPHLVPIAAGAYGKPELSLPGRSVSFNTAHSGDIILIALCLDGSVGVDVEHLDPALNFMEVGQHSFTSAENKSLATIADPDERRSAFYRCWTQKEAIAKADGRGLSLPTSSFEVSLLPMHYDPITIDQSAVFYVTDLPLGSTAAGAIATDSRDCNLRLLTFPDRMTEPINP